MITVFAILAGAALSTRYKVLCLVPITLAGIAAVAMLDRFNEVPLSSTALSALALAVGLQAGYLVGAIVRSMLPFASSVREPKRLNNQPARIS